MPRNYTNLRLNQNINNLLKIGKSLSKSSCNDDLGDVDEEVLSNKKVYDFNPKDGNPLRNERSSNINLLPIIDRSSSSDLSEEYKEEQHYLAGISYSHREVDNPHDHL